MASKRRRSFLPFFLTNRILYSSSIFRRKMASKRRQPRATAKRRRYFPKRGRRKRTLRGGGGGDDDNDTSLLPDPPVAEHRGVIEPASRIVNIELEEHLKLLENRNPNDPLVKSARRVFDNYFIETQADVAREPMETAMETERREMEIEIPALTTIAAAVSAEYVLRTLDDPQDMAKAVTDKNFPFTQFAGVSEYIRSSSSSGDRGSSDLVQPPPTPPPPPPPKNHTYTYAIFILLLPFFIIAFCIMDYEIRKEDIIAAYAERFTAQPTYAPVSKKRQLIQSHFRNHQHEESPPSITFFFSMHSTIKACDAPPPLPHEYPSRVQYFHISPFTSLVSIADGDDNVVIEQLRYFQNKHVQTDHAFSEFLQWLKYSEYQNNRFLSFNHYINSTLYHNFYRVYLQAYKIYKAKHGSKAADRLLTKANPYVAAFFEQTTPYFPHKEHFKSDVSARFPYIYSSLNKHCAAVTTQKRKPRLASHPYVMPNEDEYKECIHINRHYNNSNDPNSLGYIFRETILANAVSQQLWQTEQPQNITETLDLQSLPFSSELARNKMQRALEKTRKWWTTHIDLGRRFIETAKFGKSPFLTNKVYNLEGKPKDNFKSGIFITNFSKFSRADLNKLEKLIDVLEINGHTVFRLRTKNLLPSRYVNKNLVDSLDLFQKLQDLFPEKIINIIDSGCNSLHKHREYSDRVEFCQKPLLETF